MNNTDIIFEELLYNPNHTSISNICEQYNVKRIDFYREFSLKYNSSPKIFCDKVKFIAIIEKIFSNKSIKYYDYGYKSPEAFSRAFKRWVGMKKMI